MRRATCLLFTVAAVSLVLVPSLRAVPPTRTTFVELDVVALDSDDRPVRGLHSQDFTVKDDGRPVAITSFTEVMSSGIDGREDGRSLVLLLDDMVTPIATTRIQNVAGRFVNRARPYDTIDVVRLTHRDDELSGKPSVALDRLTEFKGGSLSYFGRSPVDDMLQTVSRISRSLEATPHRRTAVVCIGTRSVCDPYFRAPDETLVWRSWRDAISTAAAAHASVYIVDAAGVESAVDLGAGLVETTGGLDFVRSNNFDRAADRIWEQIGHYYLLGYTPIAKRRDLHTINVSISRSGVRPLVRDSRGD